MKGARLALAMAALVMGAGGAQAHEYELGSLAIGHPWARATPPGAAAGAAYMEMANGGDEDRRLVSAASPVAQRVELHEHRMDNGIMRMREVDGGIHVPAGAEIIMAPGGLHVMLMGLTRDLVEGDVFPLSLTFENGESVEVEVVVKGRAAGGHGHHSKQDQ